MDTKISIVRKHIKPRWKDLKLEFLKGPWVSVEDFARDKGDDFPELSKTIKLKTIGWEVEKKALAPIVLEKASLSLIEAKAKQLQRVQQRHVKLAKLMQNKGQEALGELEVTDIEQARKLLLTGMEQERAALKIGEKGGGSQNLTQVNVNLSKTKFDEILDGQDLEGLLELIANIRREKARRAGTDSIIQE